MGVSSKFLFHLRLSKVHVLWNNVLDNIDTSLAWKVIIPLRELCGLFRFNLLLGIFFNREKRAKLDIHLTTADLIFPQFVRIEAITS